MSVIAVGVVGPIRRGAVRWAAERAAARGLALRVIHVVPSGLDAVGGAELQEAAEAAGQGFVTEAGTIAHTVAPGLAIEPVVQRGNPRAVFDAQAADAELLVFSSDFHSGPAFERGTHGLNLGSPYRIPVAIVPEEDVSQRNGILVGVDESATAQHALAFAAAEASRTNSLLRVLHAWAVVGVTTSDFMPAIAPQDLEDGAAAVLESALQPILDTYPGLSVQRELVANTAPRALIEGAATAQLLVVGSHRRGPIARLVLGSVSRAVVAQLPGPVVVVPAPHE